MKKKIVHFTIYFPGQGAYDSHAMGNPSKDEIKWWLRWYGFSHAWLAERLGVSVHTIDNWLGSRQPIPRLHMLRVVELMSVCLERGEEFPVMDDDVLRLTLPEKLAALVEEAARRQQVSPAEFAARALRRHAGVEE